MADRTSLLPEEELAKQYQPGTDLGSALRKDNPYLNAQNKPRIPMTEAASAAKFPNSDLAKANNKDLQAAAPKIAPPVAMGPAGPPPIMPPPAPKPPAQTGVFSNGMPGQAPSSVGAEGGLGTLGSTPSSLTAPGGQDHFLSDLYKKRIQEEEQKKLHPWGSADNHPGFLGKLGHVAAKIGNIGLDVFAPEAAAMIPGTELNRQFKERNNEAGYNESKKEEDAASAAKNKNAAAQGKFVHFYEGNGGKMIGVKADGSTEELQGAAAKPNTETMKFTEAGPDGKPHDVAYILDKNKLAGVQPGPTGYTKEQLQQAGALTPLTLGEATAKPGTGGNTASHFKEVPTGPDTKAMADFSKPDAATGKPYTIVSPNYKSGTVQWLVDPDNPSHIKGYNNKTAGEVDTSQLTTGHTPQDKGANYVPPLVERATIMQRNQFETLYQKPATDIDQNFQKFQQAYKHYLTTGKDTTGADSMVALAQHLGSTFGSVKGSQMGENMIREHKDAIGWLDRIDRFAQAAASGQQLTADQWKDFSGLITNTRNIQWETTAKEAARQHLPVDMVPRDVKLEMHHGNKTYHVAGDKIQEALQDGLVF